MKNNAIALIHYTLERLSSLAFSLTHRTKPEYFSRSPKMLTFENTALIILNLLRRAIAVETMIFFSRFTNLSKLPSRQAFSEARDKISYLAFEDFFDKSCELAVTAKDARTYKSYRLFAVDGTSFFVGKLEEEALREFFGESTTVEGKAMCRISAVVDICTKTLYNYIDKGVFASLSNKDLWVKKDGKKRSYKKIRTVALNNKNGKSIRPLRELKEREEEPI